MNESNTIRPTKKQHDLLAFIDDFINSHGYSPSYREIMTGLNYTSVATVSLHVNNLIKRGHLQKRDRSARSLEVVKKAGEAGKKIVPKQLTAKEEKWLIEKVELFFKDAEQDPKLSTKDLDQLYVLIGALKVLGLDGAAQAFISRLTKLKEKKSKNQFSV